MNFKTSIISLLSLLFISWGIYQPYIINHNESFRNKIIRISENPGMESANWGISVFCVESQSEIHSYNGHLSLIPASTLKSLTTLTALIKLGENFEYKTGLGYDGYIDKSGTLHGNVLIIGSGDPSLGAGRMHDSLSLEVVIESFYKMLKESGINSVNGSVIADTRVFDKQMVSPKWLWEDIGNYFGAGTSGLSVNENEYSVFFNGAVEIGGETTVIKTEPEVPGMILYNQVRTAATGTGDNVYIYGAPYSNERWLTGTIPLQAKNFEVRGSMPDPALFFANYFADYINKNGIKTTGLVDVLHSNDKVNNLYENINVIGYWTSPALKDIAYRTNMASVNSYAESLLKTLAFYETQKGNTKEGIRIMSEFWESKGVCLQGTRLHDGSGLSPTNKIAPSALANVLAVAAKEEIFESFITGLPVAGRSGSLRNTLKGTFAENNLTAKSGFLGNVRAFAGYKTTREGKLIAFAFIVNDFDGTHASLRIIMNDLMNALGNIEN